MLAVEDLIRIGVAFFCSSCLNEIACCCMILFELGCKIDLLALDVRASVLLISGLALNRSGDVEACSFESYVSDSLPRERRGLK